MHGPGALTRWIGLDVDEQTGSHAHDDIPYTGCIRRRFPTSQASCCCAQASLLRCFRNNRNLPTLTAFDTDSAQTESLSMPSQTLQQKPHGVFFVGTDDAAKLQLLELDG